MFRTPTDNPENNLQYYEDEYSQGFTTSAPSDESLSSLLEVNFEGTEKSWSYYNEVLRRLGLKPGARIFDFGCSWGYGSYQMAAAGYSVLAFEIAPTRSKYAAERLGIALVEDARAAAQDPALIGTFDCFFSSHVLEHVSKPSEVFELAAKLLAPGALFVSFTPNGCESARKTHSDWNQWWGEVHPNFIDDVFMDLSFRNCPRTIGSSPVDGVELPTSNVLRRLDDLTAPELFFAARVPQGSFFSAK